MQEMQLWRVAILVTYALVCLLLVQDLIVASSPEAAAGEASYRRRLREYGRHLNVLTLPILITVLFVIMVRLWQAI